MLQNKACPAAGNPSTSVTRRLPSAIIHQTLGLYCGNCCGAYLKAIYVKNFVDKNGIRNNRDIVTMKLEKH